MQLLQPSLPEQILCKYHLSFKTFIASVVCSLIRSIICQKSIISIHSFYSPTFTKIFLVGLGWRSCTVKAWTVKAVWALYILPESRNDRTCKATWCGNQDNMSWQFGGQLLCSTGSIATDSICIWGNSHSSCKMKINVKVGTQRDQSLCLAPVAKCPRDKSFCVTHQFLSKNLVAWTEIWSLRLVPQN